MQAYRDFAPTAFDSRGAFLDDDRQDWLVLPVSQTRDSGPLDQSNFETAQKILTDGREDAEDFEVHRFGHWGPGWFEIIIVQPGSRAAELAEEIAERMEDYPVLDEEDHSRREWEDFLSSWDSWGRRQLIDDIVDQFDLGDVARYALDDVDSETLREWWMQGANFPYEPDGDGVTIPTDRVSDWFDRGDIAALLRTARTSAQDN